MPVVLQSEARSKLSSLGELPESVSGSPFGGFFPGGRFPSGEGLPRPPAPGSPPGNPHGARVKATPDLRALQRGWKKVNVLHLAHKNILIDNDLCISLKKFF